MIYSGNIISEIRQPVALRQEMLGRLLAIMAFIVAFLEIGHLSGLLANIVGLGDLPVIYSFICFIPIIVFIKSRQFTVDVVLMLFCVACAISLIFNNLSVHYMSVLRFGLFLVLLTLLTPLVDSEPLRQFRRYCWRYAMILCCVAVILSLVAYMVTLLRNGLGNPFVVIACPNTLGLIAAVVSIWLTVRLIGGWTRPVMLILNVVCLLASILLMIYCGARSAILGFIVAETYIAVVNIGRWRMMRWVYVAVVAGVGISFLAGGMVTYRVVRKFEIGKVANCIIFSRKQLWQSRIEEFAESPVVGIGFTNATRYSTLYGNEEALCVSSHRREEPGSSWLSVLSNTGVVGFAALAWFNIGLLRKVRNRRKAGDPGALEPGALLLLFLVVAFFEGYMLYAGSFVFFLYWLLTSRIHDDGGLQAGPG